MDSRERILRVLSGGIPDRVPLTDGFWTTTIERWRREGLPADADPYAYLGVNELVLIGGDETMQFPEQVIEERNLLRHYRDSDGALRRDLHTDEGWTSQWLDFTIKTREDWAKHRWRMAFNDARLPATALDAYHRARTGGQCVGFSSHACFHPAFMRVGMMGLFVIMLDDPDFAYDLMSAHAQLVMDLYEGLRRMGIEFDVAFMADDLGYQAAPLISPALYRQLVFPHHQRLCAHFAAHGLKTILHSDGNVAPLIPHFLDAGFAALNPLEAKAGLDVRILKPRYGDRLVLYGNIDVRKLAGSKEEIEEEISSKVPVAKEHGGYIYHSDHSVPNNVSFESYRFAIELVKRYGQY